MVSGRRIDSMKRTIFLALCISALAPVVACNIPPPSERRTRARPSATKTSATKATPPAPLPIDASAFYACRDFARMYTDIKAGIVTEAEMRERVKEIHQTARLAKPKDAPGLRESTEALLAAMTSGTTNEGLAAITAIANVCDTCVWQREQQKQQQSRR
jgi:hypothetical protein